jgi:hypothetical protein
MIWIDRYNELNSSEFMNSGIPLENFPLVPRGHHHYHRDHLAKKIPIYTQTR